MSRMTPHSSQDDDSYRTEAEKQAALDDDPMPRARERLFELGALDAEADARLWQLAEREMARAAEEAKASPLPAPERARRYLYAEDGEI